LKHIVDVDRGRGVLGRRKHYSVRLAWRLIGLI
jgi:hypothetical protein